MFNKKDQRGVAMLLLVVIVGVAGLILALNASFLGLGELTTSYTRSKGVEALSIAEGCAEEALERLRKDSTYGSGGAIILNLGNGSCIITVTDTGGGGRTIEVLATLDKYHKKIELTATLSGGVVLVNSWTELSN